LFKWKPKENEIGEKMRAYPRIQVLPLFFAFTLVLSSGATLFAQEAEKNKTLEDMVVTATRSDEKVKEIPVKIEVVDLQQIELTVGETITEQLKKNSSIGVIEYPGALAGIGIRGFRPEFSGITKHSLLLINGRPAGATNLSTILSDSIARIEVLKGPASSLYGGEAMGGVVNVILKKNTNELTGMAELGYGSFQTNFQKGAVGGAIGKGFDLDLSVRRYDQADDITMGNGDERPNTSYLAQNALLRLGADVGDGWRVDLTGDIYQGRDIETPGDTFDGSSKSGLKDIDRYGVDLTIDGQLGAFNLLSLTAYQTSEVSETYKRYIGYGNPTPVDPYRSYDSETAWQGIQLKDTISFGGHRFIAGIDYQMIDKENRSYNQDGTRKAPYSPNEGRENWAGYLETIWKFMDQKLTATVGGRYDTFEVESKSTPYKTDFTPNGENFSTFSPRAGLNYIFDIGLRLHGTVGKAFVPPTAAQLAYYAETQVDGVTMITRGNSGLDPESSITYDLGIGYDAPGTGLSLDFTYFHTDIDDKITRVTRGTTTTYENSLGGEIQGLESTLSFDLGALADWNRTLALFVNATNIFKSEEEEPDGTMKDTHNVAEYTYNYGIRYDDGLLDAKLHVRNQGPMKDTDWNTAGYPEIEYPSFTVVDLAAGVNFLKHHRCTLKIDNILDEDYYEKKGFPKPGRAFYISYRYEF
jgi:vitamin B12 transporter